MFGPNSYFMDDVKIEYSHRDPQFFKLFDNVKTKFSDTFNLHEYDILFIPGSATVGIEALVSSCDRPITVIGVDGTFKRRWHDLCDNYRASKIGEPLRLYCRLETSCSKSYYEEGCFVDAVSAFPYFDLPKDCLGFVTSCNKQLGSYVGLSIVGIRKDAWRYFKQNNYMSYLNLIRYKEASKQGQTPSTTPVHIFRHFLKCLESFDLGTFRDRVNTVSDIVVSYVGSDNIIGEPRGPVITIKKSAIPDSFADKYELYGRFCKDRPYYQVFTYSQDIDDYKRVFHGSNNEQ